MENVIYYSQNTRKRKYNYSFSFLSFSAVFVVNLIADLFFDNLRVQYKVNLSTSLLILLFLIIFNYVSDNLNRFLLFFWYVFYLCGTLFLNSVAVFDPKITIPNENADNFYFVCLISLTLGIIISENMYRRSYYVNIPLVNSIPLGFTSIFFVFPFLFLLSTYSKIGFIPILTGGSIIEDMYNYDYGPLYSYKYLINISILIAIYYAMSRPKKWIYISLAVIFALITLIDGKRAVLLSSIISGGILYWLYSAKFYKVNYKLIIVLLSGAFIMYSALSSLRAGKSNEITGIQSIIEKFPVGVEYTDYVYSFETFEVGQLKNYSFFKSSVGAFVNSSLLTALDLDKKELVETGSAYAWMREYGIDLGIRTGIISELYFDYGIVSIFLMFIMGFILDWIVRSIYKTKDIINLMLLISIFGMNVLLIVGQATVYFGTLTLVLYVYIFYKTFKLFAK